MTDSAGGLSTSIQDDAGCLRDVTQDGARSWRACPGLTKYDLSGRNPRSRPEGTYLDSPGQARCRRQHAPPWVFVRNRPMRPEGTR